MSDASSSEPLVSDAVSVDESASRIPTRKLVLSALIVGVPIVVYFVLPLDKEFGEVLAMVLVVATAGSLIPISIRQAQLVLRSEDPLFDAARCIISVLVMLVVAFSSAYYVLGTGNEDQIEGLATKLDAIYFTVTILATVGFGDISATGQLARAIVTTQMVVNLAVLAIALRVVSWALKERGPEEIARRHARAAEKRR